MEFELSGVTYKSDKINAVEQFHIARRLAPVLAELSKDKENTLNNLANAISKLSNEDADFVLFGLLKCISMKESNGLGWSKISNGNMLMRDSITLPIMMQMAYKALMLNFGDFFSALPSKLPGAN